MGVHVGINSRIWLPLTQLLLWNGSLSAYHDPFWPVFEAVSDGTCEVKSEDWPCGILLLKGSYLTSSQNGEGILLGGSASHDARKMGMPASMEPMKRAR